MSSHPEIHPDQAPELLKHLHILPLPMAVPNGKPLNR